MAHMEEIGELEGKKSFLEDINLISKRRTMEGILEENQATFV